MRSGAKSQARHARNVSAPPADKGRDYTHTAERNSFLSHYLSIVHHQLPFASRQGFSIIVILLVGLISKALGSAASGLLEQALATVQDCMARSPAPWPDDWQHEYLDTIRRAAAPRPDALQYAERLAILSMGFQPYWEGL